MQVPFLLRSAATAPRPAATAPGAGRTCTSVNVHIVRMGVHVCGCHKRFLGVRCARTLVVVRQACSCGGTAGLFTSLLTCRVGSRPRGGAAPGPGTAVAGHPGRQQAAAGRAAGAVIATRGRQHAQGRGHVGLAANGGGLGAPRGRAGAARPCAASASRRWTCGPWSFSEAPQSTTGTAGKLAGSIVHAERGTAALSSVACDWACTAVAGLLGDCSQ